ncbi:MAG TPA: branched-chain amino acid ABC transporter permease, partial [Egibacteraceae bacterium]|nr:branched-chain amino acid ABC transporter permease [Egibacteraceae bacterium]
NLAHGELVMLGAYATWGLSSAGRLGPLGAVAAVIPAMFAVGYVIERLLLRPLTPRRALSPLLATLGLSIVLQQAVRIVFSPTPHAAPLPLEGVWRIAGVNVAAGRALLLVAALGIVAGLAGFLRTTRLGRSVRAVAQNPGAAQLIGIDIARVRTLAFALSTAAAGAAGALISQAQPIHPAMGPPLLLRAVAIAALVGPGRVTGALAGGVALGVFESMIAAFVPRVGANVGVIAAAAVLVVMLVVRRASLVEGPPRTWAS